MKRKSFNKIILIYFLAAFFLIVHSRVQAACVNPSSGMAGQTMDVTIKGADTHFDSTSQVSFSCQGITVNSVTANSATEIVANITVAANASEAQCDVTVTTGTEVITCLHGFGVFMYPCGTHCLGVTPSGAIAGETRDVIIRLCDIDVSGLENLGVTFSCTGITVNSATANSAAEIVANISIAAGAPQCTGDVLITGGPSGTSGSVAVMCKEVFTVNALPPCSLTLEPNSLRTGFLFPRLHLITIKSSNANFSSESTVEIEGVRFIKVMNTSAAGDVINARVVIPPRFIIGNGTRQVKITTGNEICTGVLEIQ